MRYTDRREAGRELGRLLATEPALVRAGPPTAERAAGGREGGPAPGAAGGPIPVPGASGGPVPGAAGGPGPAGDTVVLALPRGGVPVAVEVARALGAPLDVVVVRKVGLPGQPEVGAGAVTEDGVVFLDQALLTRVRLTTAGLERVVAAERAELARRVESYRHGGSPASLAGRVAVVVDDGLARGVTAVAAVRAVRSRGAAMVVVAVPVASTEGVQRVARECDAVVCPVVLDRFGAVGRYYRDFAQVSDEEVRALLGSCL